MNGGSKLLCFHTRPLMDVEEKHSHFEKRNKYANLQVATVKGATAVACEGVVLDARLRALLLL